MSSNNTSSGGIGFTGVLAIVFIVLKLVEVIDWSWWWVLAPLWIPWGIFTVVMLVAVAVALFVHVVEWMQHRVHRRALRNFANFDK